MHLTIGYHTVGDRSDLEYVKNHAPFKCTRVGAWLSHGYYFWENDFAQAHEWGRVGYRNRYIICEANLVLKNMFDLLANREHQLKLKGLIGIFKELEQSPQGYDPSISEVIAYFRIINDEVDPGSFPYDSVRAFDIPHNNTPYKFVESKSYTTYLDMRVQICLFELMEGNLQSFGIAYPKQ